MLHIYLSIVLVSSIVALIKFRNKIFPSRLSCSTSNRFIDTQNEAETLEQFLEKVDQDFGILELDITESKLSDNVGYGDLATVTIN